jgi:hypothetical protein
MTDLPLSAERAALARKGGEHPTQPKRKHYSTARNRP